MIPVTRPHLPDRAKLDRYIDGIYERNWLTNNGPLVQELEERLCEHLGVEHLLLLNNGTLALHIAYRALGVTQPGAEAVTTPFSFVATTSSLQWEHIKPVFADIDPASFNLAPELAERAIGPQTRAIVPVHVYGNPCDVEAFEDIGRRHRVPVIYDGAHAFGVRVSGKGVFSFGDAATISFHATKLFHTIEGGAIVFRKKEHLEFARRLANFGQQTQEAIHEVGTNAKMNEFQAAMGLCVLDELDDVSAGRRVVCEAYDDKLHGRFQTPEWHPHGTQNHAYYAIAARSAGERKAIVERLAQHDVVPRRYFAPALNRLPTVGPDFTPCEVAESLAGRVLCLPLWSRLDPEVATGVANIILDP